MEGDLSEDITIRRYLLGQLDTSPEVVEQLHDRMLGDDAFSEMVGVIEDEIIEEYLEGTLDFLDTQAVEEHFLRPPERRQKLHIARRFNQHLERKPIADHKASSVIASIIHWQSSSRTYAGLAAIMLVTIISGIYITSLRHNFQSELSNNQHQLAQERERFVQFQQQLKSLPNTQQQPIVLLSLLEPGRRRAGGPPPVVMVGPATRHIHIEIRLQDTSASECNVRLFKAYNSSDTFTEQKAIWSKTQLQPLKSSGTALLIFDLPTAAIKGGSYEFRIRQYPNNTHELSYFFEVTIFNEL